MLPGLSTGPEDTRETEEGGRLLTMAHGYLTLPGVKLLTRIRSLNSDNDK